MKSLLELLGPDFPRTNYCGSEYYLWEKLAEDELKRRGYSDFRWFDGEADSFGPLTRVLKCKDPENKQQQFIYG
jgi:hypothetical protein